VFVIGYFSRVVDSLLIKTQFSQKRFALCIDSEPEFYAQSVIPLSIKRSTWIGMYTLVQVLQHYLNVGNNQLAI